MPPSGQDNKSFFSELKGCYVLIKNNFYKDLELY